MDKQLKLYNIMPTKNQSDVKWGTESKGKSAITHLLFIFVIISYAKYWTEPNQHWSPYKK